MQPRELVEKFYADYERGDVDAILASCDENFTFNFVADGRYSKYSGIVVGKDGFLKRADSLQKDFEYLGFKRIDLIAEGDRVAVRHEMRMKGRVTGVEISVQVADFWTVRDGKALELMEFYDTALVATML
jgi:uncharacterized protein